jgi:hypothetical protein
MIDNRVYKRVKIHWWVIIILMGFVVWMIFAYIHQWGNNPVDKAGLVIFSIMFVGSSILIFTERYILTIDDKFVFFKFGSSSGCAIKIHITQIEDVRLEEWSFRTCLKALRPRGTHYSFDFTRQAIKIETKNGEIYRIAIRNAEKVKEEIEKRMSNNIINNMLITD